MTIFTDPPPPPATTQTPLVATQPRPELSVEYRPTVDAWYHMAGAYLTAGKHLLGEIRRDRSLAKELLPPALFLIRHSVELHLKSLIHDSAIVSHLDITPAEQTVMGLHDLSKLWDLLEIRFGRLGGKHNSARWKRTGEVVRQFSALDHSSFEFRYPERKATRAPTAGGTGILLDLKQFEEVLDELYFILESTSAWLYELGGIGP